MKADIEKMECLGEGWAEFGSDVAVDSSDVSGVALLFMAHTCWILIFSRGFCDWNQGPSFKK